MASQVLARKWRPRDFEHVVGQEPVVQALTHALRENRLHHAYLFTGTRGVGKTTLSRILAKSLNCVGPDGKGGVTDHPCGVCEACRAIDEGRFVDYIEMDAASNRSVEEMTALLEQAMYAPTNARYKVYMIDEVHQLTSHAFNAMLKTLEEPPEYVKFILATTDPQKVPVTVLSRCLQFNLRNVTPQIVAEHMAHILKEEHIEAEPAALKLLGVGARGSMRDGLSLLDQAIAFAGDGPVTLESVREMLGMMDSDVLVKLLEHLAQGNAHEMIKIASDMSLRSLSFSQAIRDMAGILQRVALAQFDAASIPADDLDREVIFKLAGLFSPQEIQLYYQIALHARADMSLAPDEYAGFTMALMRMLAFKPVGSGNGFSAPRFSPVKPETQTDEPSVARHLPESALATAITTAQSLETAKRKEVDRPDEVPATETIKKSADEPAPWEDLPGESEAGSLAKAAQNSETPSVRSPVEAEAVESGAEERKADAAAQSEDDEVDEDDEPYVPPEDDYLDAMGESIDDPGFGYPLENHEPDFEAGSALKTVVDDVPADPIEDLYDYDSGEEKLPEFTPTGKMWFEKLRYTYPATFARDILERSECVSIEGNVITLRLDPVYQRRVESERAMLQVQRIVDPLFGQRMRFEFIFEEPKSRTIFQEKRRLAQEAEKKAKQNAPKYESIDDPAELKQSVARLKETPLAHMLARRFNATLDRKSVVRRLK